jgi:hypothetical protein
MPAAKDAEMSSADPYELEDDRGRLDRDAIWGFLSHEAYWGRWRSRPDVELQIKTAWRVGFMSPDKTVLERPRSNS